MVKPALNLLTKNIKVPKTRKSRAPVSLRTTRDELYYNKVKQKRAPKTLLEEDRIKEWQHWALIDNDFPYSAAFKIHHMLIPKRVVDEKNLTDDEHDEMHEIINELSEVYDCILLNFKKKQSIRDHFHLHLLIYKDKRKEMRL